MKVRIIFNKLSICCSGLVVLLLTQCAIINDTANIEPKKGNKSKTENFSVEIENKDTNNKPDEHPKELRIKESLELNGNDTVFYISEKVTKVYLKEGSDSIIGILKENYSIKSKDKFEDLDKSNEIKNCYCNDIVTFNNNKWCNHKMEFCGFIFSDFVGIKDDQPNGLVQTNFYISYLRPTKIRYDKVCNKDSVKNKICWNPFPRLNKKLTIDSTQTNHLGVFIARNAVLLDITFSKMENENRELPVRYDTITHGRYLNKYDLLQYANVISLSKINIATFRWHNVLSTYLDYTPIFYSTAVLDTLLRKDAFRISSIAHGFNLKVSTVKDKESKLSADCSFSVFLPHIISGNFSDSAEYQMKENITGQQIVPHKKYPSAIQAIDIRIARDIDKKISAFLRFAAYGNFLCRKEDEPRNNFVQFQLGATLNIDKIISSSSK